MLRYVGGRDCQPCRISVVVIVLVSTSRVPSKDMECAILLFMIELQQVSGLFWNLPLTEIIKYLTATGKVKSAVDIAYV